MSHTRGVLLFCTTMPNMYVTYVGRAIPVQHSGLKSEKMCIHATTLKLTVNEF